MTNKVCHVPRTTRKQINFHLLKQQSRLIGKTFAPTFRLSRKDLCTFDRKDCKKKLWTEGRVTGYSSWWQHECYFRVHFESHKPHAGHFSFGHLRVKTISNFPLRLPFTRHQLWPQTLQVVLSFCEELFREDWIGRLLSCSLKNSWLYNA